MQAATLQQQVNNLQKQRQQEASNATASSEHLQREMQGHCTNMQAQLDACKVCCLQQTHLSPCAMMQWAVL